ncbi:alcohol oxidase [Fusarium denticulatum]|uniref:Alcohol oxidase n=1 Tax=Fusarium denticulatum TaxID=48507 RepID=A0A8H5TCT7_9HYPO|nr:alcohol oxidase [Fusarium denticulatum]
MKLWTWIRSNFVTAVAATETYDYIIVGGGTAGGALATRLSLGLPKSKILLLEAGPEALDDVSIAQPGLNGRSISVNRGKVLGGSSAINFLCYGRAASAEYDAWSELGSPGWNWDTMINGMTKSENFTGNDGDVHGRSGPISSTYNRIVPDVLKPWQSTVNKLGVPINDGGSLGGKPVGVMFQPTNIDVGARGYPGNSPNFITIFSSIMHPMSRGSVHMNGQDVKGKPIIDLNYLNNEYDIQALIEGARFARKVAETEPLRSVWAAEYEPGLVKRTYAQLRDWVVRTVNSFYHPAGTCAMLPKKDGGVADSNLKVYGTKILRVVDASIIPVQLSAHIQTAVYGIAETAAQKIIAAENK